LESGRNYTSTSREVGVVKDTVREQFEKWFVSNRVPDEWSENSAGMWDAYVAGRAEGIEEAAKLVESTITTKHWYSTLTEGIRALAKDGQ
jgi:hypothetical protein